MWAGRRRLADVATRKARREPDAVRITTAPPSHHDDVLRRRRRYMISMTIRTLCFIGAVFFTGTLRWILVAASLILPYVAVVMANAASPRIPGTDLVAPHSGTKELGGS